MLTTATVRSRRWNAFVITLFKDWLEIFSSVFLCLFSSEQGYVPSKVIKVSNFIEFYKVYQEVILEPSKESYYNSYVKTQESILGRISKGSVPADSKMTTKKGKTCFFSYLTFHLTFYIVFGFFI